MLRSFPERPTVQRSLSCVCVCLKKADENLDVIYQKPESLKTGINLCFRRRRRDDGAFRWTNYSARWTRCSQSLDLLFRDRLCRFIHSRALQRSTLDDVLKIVDFNNLCGRARGEQRTFIRWLAAVRVHEWDGYLDFIINTEGRPKSLGVLWR